MPRIGITKDLSKFGEFCAQRQREDFSNHYWGTFYRQRKPEKMAETLFEYLHGERDSGPFVQRVRYSENPDRPHYVINNWDIAPSVDGYLFEEIKEMVQGYDYQYVMRKPLKRLRKGFVTAVFRHFGVLVK